MPGPRWTNAGHVTRNDNRRRYPAGRDARRAPTGGVQVFAAAHRHLDAMDAPDPLRDQVTHVEAEVGRGDDADAAAIVRTLCDIAGTAPELATLLAVGLVDPTAGVATTVRAAAEHAIGCFDPPRP